jgi:membrane protein implicated in regulation of membrane protease activity
MTRVRAFLAAVWEFIVGDDWRTAIGVALAIALTALVASTGISAWWVMPLAVLGLLALSIRRAARGASRGG